MWHIATHNLARSESSLTYACYEVLGIYTGLEGPYHSVGPHLLKLNWLLFHSGMYTYTITLLFNNGAVYNLFPNKAIVIDFVSFIVLP